MGARCLLGPMRLVADASVLVAELLRARGRALVAHPQLDLVVAAEAIGEAEHELRKRVMHIVTYGHLQQVMAQQLLDDALATITSRVTLVPSEVYADQMEEARRRIPRDLYDVPSVAFALALDCGIWTDDHDFFGCGISVWTTETLLLYLQARERPTVNQPDQREKDDDDRA